MINKSLAVVVASTPSGYGVGPLKLIACCIIRRLSCHTRWIVIWRFDRPNILGFPKIGVPQNRWFSKENLIYGTPHIELLDLYGLITIDLFTLFSSVTFEHIPMCLEALSGVWTDICSIVVVQDCTMKSVKFCQGNKCRDGKRLRKAPVFVTLRCGILRFAMIF